MASKNESYEASRDYRRVSDLPVSKEFRVGIEAIAMAHAGQGNLTEFKVMMAALGKTNSLASIEMDIKRLEKLVLAQLDSKGG